MAKVKKEKRRRRMIQAEFCIAVAVERQRQVRSKILRDSLSPTRGAVTFEFRS